MMCNWFDYIQRWLAIIIHHQYKASSEAHPQNRLSFIKLPCRRAAADAHQRLVNIISLSSSLLLLTVSQFLLRLRNCAILPSIYGHLQIHLQSLVSNTCSTIS